ncbi:hypothetical protein B0H15DRAFT_436590 [Mycena belliarum]|uniref:F-box domain-containing protein n=1 Tax=Mycena belliarum TaxID=1033014 RepID=A0AAD6U0D6_9AGAR|nr:hypothetical protein B0H15DRAFT_436590 [Mycena belliae]
METPFQHMLDTNAVPSDSECQHIHDFLAAPQQELIAISKQIQELVQKQDELNHLINSHRALVSLARRLPDDVMRAVFIAALPSSHNAIMDLAEPPLLFCAVSRAWRSLAISTPRLWASLHVVAPPDHRSLQVNDAVATWLSRSGSLPLSISVACSQAQAPVSVSALLETLLPFASRWHHLMLSLHGSYQAFAPLEDLDPEDVPILATILIDGLEGVEAPVADAEYLNCVRFADAPTVHSVALRCIARPGELPLSWATLRRFTFGGPGTKALSTRRALELLRKSPALEFCTLNVVDRTASRIPDTPPVRSERLQHLCVVDRSGAIKLFDQLDLPALRSLEYETREHVPALPFLPLLARTNNLVRLSVKLADAAAATLAEALQLVPTLEELTLHKKPPSDLEARSTKDDPIFRLLTPASSTPPLCPRLQRLSLAHFAADSGSALLALLHARASDRDGPRAVARLQSIRATLPRRALLDVDAQIAPLVARGLHAVLRYAPRTPARAAYSPSDGLQAHDADWQPISASWDSEGSRRGRVVA